MTTQLYPKTPIDDNSSTPRRLAKTRAVLGPCYCPRFDVDHDFDVGCPTLDGIPLYAPIIGSRPIPSQEELVEQPRTLEVIQCLREEFQYKGDTDGTFVAYE